MNVLLLGSGGREHALAMAIVRSPKIGRLFCIPGNPGIASIAQCSTLPLTDAEALIEFVRNNNIELTVVGPEAPLAAGIVDKFVHRGLRIFGPTRGAAELEWSKAYAKEFMTRHHIPTAAYRTFGADDLNEARAYLLMSSYPVVLKADGLAAGKGVIICATPEEASHALALIAEEKAFGEAGDRIVVEEFLQGEEASVFAVSDGKHYVLLASAQDHKRALDGDRGKNTGGMGAYAPAPCVTDAVLRRVEDEIVRPVLRGMVAEGREYRGCLYVGLMLTSHGPKVVEFNCRFGDPETQVVVPLYSGDFLALLAESADGAFSATTQEEAGRKPNGTAVCVVMASGGYPDAFRKGIAIQGLDKAAALPGISVLHAGTGLAGGKVVTTGGRVLAVTAVDPHGRIAEAAAMAYDAVRQIHFDGAHFRHDIAHRALTQSRHHAG